MEQGVLKVQSRIEKRWLTLSAVQTAPRILLFFLAVIFTLTASALTAAGFVLGKSVLLISGSVLWLAWFVIMFAVAVPATDGVLRRQMRWLKRIALVIFAVLALAGALEVVVMTSGLSLGKQSAWLVGALHGMFGYNDSTALTHQAADNFINGKNPYASANIISASLRFGGSHSKVTPLRQGRFEDAFPYPTDEQLKEVWKDGVNNPQHVPPELESRLNYPAGSFLLPAPFLRMGMNDLRKVYPIFVLPALAYALWRIRRDMRIVFAAALLVSLELWNSLASGETGSLAFPLLLMGWVLLRRKLWLSALFMGLAVATKQVAWFFIPFYLILLFRTASLKRTAYVTGIIAVIFLVMNVPFMISDFKLWLNSVAAPITEPMFPLGVGLVTLVTGGVLDIRSPLPFTIAELSVAAVAIVWYFRHCRRYPHTGPVLAILPLFFAWRSLWPYFYYTGIIVLAAVMIDDYGRVSGTIEHSYN
ncbi:MAG: DUF2029 domain-containing protein [Chloroflexi bacterium]|nr:DUF2029 domain-containing protein [Chloroflexota bacterium]